MAIDHVEPESIEEDIDSIDFETFTDTLFGFVVVAGTGTESCGMEQRGTGGCEANKILQADVSLAIRGAGSCKDRG